MAFWGREGGLPKCLEIFFLKMMSKKLKKKTQKKLQSSPHKWVLGKILQKVKKVSGKKFARVLFMRMCVCYGLHLPRKQGKVKILHLPPKKNTQVLHPAT